MASYSKAIGGAPGMREPGLSAKSRFSLWFSLTEPTHWVAAAAEPWSELPHREIHCCTASQASFHRHLQKHMHKHYVIVAYIRQREWCNYKVACFNNAAYTDGPRHSATVCGPIEAIWEVFLCSCCARSLRKSLIRLPFLIVGYIETARCMLIVAYSFDWLDHTTWFIQARSRTSYHFTIKACRWPVMPTTLARSHFNVRERYRTRCAPARQASSQDGKTVTESTPPCKYLLHRRQLEFLYSFA